MARKGAIKTRRSPEEMRASRLKLIKKRHRKLILQPRELIAAELDDNFDDVFDELAEADDLEPSRPVELNPT